jgi:predicted lipoprotein with Yx(FWY)xxD motif
MRKIALLCSARAAVAMTATAGAATSNTTISLHKTGKGMILVSSKGFTLYAFTKDACVKVGGCTKVWPPVTTTGKPQAGSGVTSSLLGTIAYKGSLKQVAYAGHPLYAFTGDEGPASTKYIDESQFGGRWPAVNAAGKEGGSDND